jgi:DNA recombination protein RmuC
MITTLLIVISILLLAVLVFLYAVMSKLSQNKPQDNQSHFSLLLDQINQINRTVDAKIGDSQRQMSETVSDQFNKSQKLIQDINKSVTDQLLTVSEGVTRVSESTKQVFTIADQLQNLEKVLKNQKQRGNLGEAGLELILSNILPPSEYKLQYGFKNGEVVDAVITTKDGIIPVDAKFSLENYSRLVNENDDTRKAELERDFKNDLKRRIDETSKYIRPGEGTLPFAFMFIPAEGIYYDLLVNEVGATKVNTRSLIDYAYNEKKVIIVSPTTFAAYLQSVLHGFKAYKIQEGAIQIQKHVRELGNHLKSYEDYHNKLGKNLQTTFNQFNQSTKEFKKIDKDILRIAGNSAELDPVLLEEGIKVDFDEE